VVDDGLMAERAQQAAGNVFPALELLVAGFLWA
jgi:hypothetical protein